MPHFRRLVLSLAASIAVIPQARAQWAVVDVPATVQLIQEVLLMEQQVQTARNQLTQSVQALQTMTGGRGMQLLLNGIARNYLPTSWPQLVAARQGQLGGYPALSADVRRALGANAVLSPQQLAALSPANQQLITAARQSSALRQALAEEALSNASGRFSALQILIGAISIATDQKGILDLQARVNSELGMLQNEQTKLQILDQASQAQDSVNRQQQREQIVAAHGVFQTRFQPVP